MDTYQKLRESRRSPSRRCTFRIFAVLRGIHSNRPDFGTDFGSHSFGFLCIKSQCTLTSSFRTATSSSTANPPAAFAKKCASAARFATSVSTTVTASEGTTRSSSASFDGRSTASSRSHASTMMASKGWLDVGGKLARPSYHF